MLKKGTKIKVVKPFNIFDVGDTGYVAEIEEEEDCYKQSWCKVYIYHDNRECPAYVILSNGKFKYDDIKEIKEI